MPFLLFSIAILEEHAFCSIVHCYNSIQIGSITVFLLNINLTLDEGKTQSLVFVKCKKNPINKLTLIELSKYNQPLMKHF